MVNIDYALVELTESEKEAFYSKDWKKFEYYIILLFTVVLLVQTNIPFVENDPFSSIGSLQYVFYLIQIDGLFPLLFDFFLVFYLIKLIRLNFNNKAIVSSLARRSKLKNILITNSLLLLYFILLALFSPPFNPLLIFNISAGSYPAFSIISLGSICLFIILIISIRNKKMGRIYYFLMNGIYYFLVLIFLSNFVLPINNFYNYSYLIPALYFITAQIFNYKFLKSNVSPEEREELFLKNKPPAWIITMGGVFDSKADFLEAYDKKCKNRGQLQLVRKYNADSYKTALDIMERDFPSYDVYKTAFAQGYKNYRDWERYQNSLQEKQEKKDKHQSRIDNLVILLKKSEKLTINQLMNVLNLNNSKPLLMWLINLPENYPIRLEGDAMVLNKNISDDQIKKVIESLFDNVGHNLD